jgi:hypothetical protein
MVLLGSRHTEQTDIEGNIPSAIIVRPCFQMQYLLMYLCMHVFIHVLVLLNFLTQGLVLARQLLHHLGHVPVLKLQYLNFRCQFF